mmetsp:Transcript_14887/g.32095  ORF Transcript_14887/g.32095 Transcript_14887/m.32095 type:complete len:562 (+) Transcript_14887:172-1857(+)
MTGRGESIIARKEGMSISFLNPNKSSVNDSFTIEDRRSPSPRKASVSVNSNESSANDSFTIENLKSPSPRQVSVLGNPNESSVNDSFTFEELRSPSPRQASVSVSFSSGKSSILDYSDDIDGSFGVLPISPVPAEENENYQEKSPCPRNPRDGPSQEAAGGTFSKIEAICESNEETTSVGLVGENFDSSNIQSKGADVQACVPVEVSTHSRNHASDCNKRNAMGQSALSISSASCFLEGMKLLIEKGADVNLQDMYGRCPLHLACENKKSDVHHHCVKFLLEKGADANTQDMYGRCPLHIAAREGCERCIQLLLDHGARPDVRNSAGDTPLHITAMMDNFTCMEALSPEVRQDVESHSSIESVSPSLLFDHESINKDIAGSFYQSPREVYPKGSFRRSHQDNANKISADEETHGDDINERDVLSHGSLRKQNDSGYFTARGSAWVKNKYYTNDKIEEERESSIASSILSDADGKYESESNASSEIEGANDSSNRTWLFKCFEVILRVVLYLLHTLLTWSKQRKLNAKLGDSSYQFVQPPDHVAKAMEMFILSNQSKCNNST